jgi:hypothetical protein
MVTNTKNDDATKLTPELSEAETLDAEKQGVKNAVTQSAETNFATQSATENNDEYAGDKWPDRHEIMQWSGLVSLGLDEFKAAIKDGATPYVPEGKVAGLLELERSGQNRTEYVEALCKRLGVKSPLEVTSAGPGHTNDVTSITKLKT